MAEASSSKSHNSSHSSHSHGSHSSPDALSTKDRKKMSGSQFAFPKERKEPLNDASHVRNAIARFDQVKGVSEPERKQAFTRIKTAAKKLGVDMKETSAAQLGKRPHTSNSAHHKKAS